MASYYPQDHHEEQWLSIHEEERLMWSLSDALELIRRIQPAVHALNYHVALAGGVLNKGQSEKDLDLVFLPLTNQGRPPLGELCNFLYHTFGDVKDNLTDKDPCVSLRFQASYLLTNGKRIDAFIV